MLVPQNRQAVLWNYVDKQYVPDMPLGYIMASADNPRKTFDPVALAELASSIREHGVQQPIIVRVLPFPLEQRPNIRVEIVAGERRYRASIMADALIIPCMVRVGMTRQEALRIAIAENLRRSDLTVIEEALSFAALADGGDTQEEIARSLGMSQSHIANRMRLLKLPSVVQHQIATNALGVSHGLQLVRYAEHPETVTQLSAVIIEEKIPSYQLEAKVLTGRLGVILQEAGIANGPSVEPSAAPVTPVKEEMQDHLLVQIEAIATQKQIHTIATETEEAEETEDVEDEVKEITQTQMDAAEESAEGDDAPERARLLQGVSEPVSASVPMVSPPAITPSTAPAPMAIPVVDKREDRLEPTSVPHSVGTPAPPAEAAGDPLTLSGSSAVSPMVMAMIPRHEHEWLLQERLTVGVAIAELRELRHASPALPLPSGFVLGNEAQRALTALTDKANRESSAKRTESDQLELIVITRARAANLLPDDWDNADPTEATDETENPS